MLKILSITMLPMFFMGMLLPFSASALVDCNKDLPNKSYSNPISIPGLGDVCTIPQLIDALVDMVLVVGMPIVALFIIYSGFLFVKAGDNESEISKAKTVFVWTIVGALVLFGAKAISMAIQETLSVFGGPTG